MARFLAAIQGSRGEATRLGTADSGIRAQAQGWDIGIRVYGDRNGEDGKPEEDCFRVYLFGGSNGHGSSVYLGRATLDANGSPVWEPANTI